MKLPLFAVAMIVLGLAAPATAGGRRSGIDWSQYIDKDAKKRPPVAKPSPSKDTSSKKTASKKKPTKKSKKAVKARSKKTRRK